MKIICLGAGSVGMLVTAKLAAAGKDVLLIARTERQAALLNESGLTLAERGAETVLPVRAKPFERPEGGAGDDNEVVETADWVFLTVKQQHLSDTLLGKLSSWLGDAGRLLCFQNGIGHVDKIAAHMPIDRIYLAVTTEGAKKLSPASVAHTGEGITRIGPAVLPEAGQISPQSADFAQKMLEKALNEAGFRTLLSNQMKEAVWNKLLMNAVINPLTALLRIRNGELLATEHRRRLMRQLLEEGIAVAKASGVEPGDGLWEQLSEICARTSANASSMLQDLSEGRSTEIDWINGAIIEAARRENVPSPLHETIYKLVKAAEPGR